jgi:predicted CXXCH cytochrome family protein
MRFKLSRVVIPGLALLAAVTTSCVDEKIVFQDRELFEEPPAAALGFLGYTDQEAKLTVCGNCHVGQQAGWETTGHADAWEGLQSSDHAQAVCEGCHTVNELGNALTEPAGYNAAQEERYHDVQCESCHGPGLDHVQNPDASQPLAPISVGEDLTTGCGECHEGAHHPFVEQWAESAHGEWSAGGYAGTRDGCNQCHNGAVALRVKYNETANYLEEADGGVLPATCAVCHDPHGSDYENNLRAPIAEASQDNLCVTCHARVGTPSNGWSSHGPHAAQGLLVLGENVGWIPPGFDYDSTSMASTHGSEANPKLCATCHVGQFNVTDANGDPFTSVGHLFTATPCIDPATGLPTAGDCETSDEYFGSCATSGCHGTAASARTAFIATKARMGFLLDELWDDIDEDHVLETSDTGVLPRALAVAGPSEFDPGASSVTTAKGAIWNAMLAYTEDRAFWGDFGIEGISGHQGAHKASGDGVHNPFLLEALLIASIEAVEDAYGVQASPRLVRTPQLKVPPGFVQSR